MKNKLLGFTLLTMASLGLMTEVGAVKITGTGPGADGSIVYEGSNIVFAHKDDTKKEYTLELKDDAAQDLDILAGETVTIDLAGHQWTNFNNQSSAIIVEHGATLIITDSASNGKITYKDDTIAGTDPSFYPALIVNHGTLIMESGLIEVNKGTDSVLPRGTGISNENDGVLTVNGGSITTTVNGCWGIGNKGEATINAGTFIQNKDYSIIANSKNLTINGGDIKTVGDGTHNSLISNDDVVAEALIMVNGGEFTTAKLFHKSLLDAENEGIVLKGGKFPVELQSAIAAYIAEGYEFIAGEVVTDADYSELNAALAEAHAIDTSKYTEASVNALNQALKMAEDLAKDLKSNQQAQIDEVVASLKNAISGLVAIEVKPDVDPEEDKDTPTDEEDNKEEENKPNENENENPSADKDTDKDNELEEAPSTLDNIFTYIALGATSLASTGVVIKKKLK